MAKITKYERQYVFCDETGVGGQRFYGFGALFMDYNRGGEFQELWADVAANARFDDEIKWTSTSNAKLNQYKRIVDFFFRHPWLRFHCIRINSSIVKRELHNGDIDLGQRKHYTMFLANKLQMSSSRTRDHRFDVRIDQLSSRYPKASEAMEAVGHNIVHAAQSPKHEMKIKEVDSKSWTCIQICDLLLGAATAPVQRSAVSGAKRELMEHVASHLGPGWRDLSGDTYPKAWKFNIWHWCPDGRARDCITRHVKPQWEG